MSGQLILRTHRGDLPNLDHYKVKAVAIDTETLGLNLHRDRLCVIQLSPGDGSVDIVQIAKDQVEAPYIVSLLENPEILKIFHYARFDVSVLIRSFRCQVRSIFCTKIASKLTRTYTDRHGLKNLCSELLNLSISKQQQSSDWAREILTQEQLEYAASDVLYLHQLQKILKKCLIREQRDELAKACFDFLPKRAALDLLGWEDCDIFSH